MEYSFQWKNESPTQFFKIDKGLFLSRLFGLECCSCGHPIDSSLFGGLLCLDTGYGSINTDQLVPLECTGNEAELHVIWEVQPGLLLESCWSFCNETGILRRRDTLKNTTQKIVDVFSAKARFIFSPGDYDVYSQASSWCNENQGFWQILHHGSICLGCEGGRTTQGGSPFMVLKESESGKAVAFHLLPVGNWNINIRAWTCPGNPYPYAVVEAGMSDNCLRLSLAPGEELKLPELLLFDASTDNGCSRPLELDFNAWKLHTYYLKHVYRMKWKEPPVIYNTWFDTFEFLDVSRLRNQLKLAKKMGCEVFVVDAGWYGASEGNWHSQVGDWREKSNSAFYGKMLEFANEVRKQGLGFGLWMEPERVGVQAPIYKEHPEWFIKGGSGFYYYDLTKSEPYSYILSEICRLVETYKLAWMKIDFNFNLGLDPSGWELKKYYDAWYSLLDQVRFKYPQLFLEGCSSGAMRLDLNTLQHFDGHFLSDNVNPWDVLSINQGALLRLPPGLLTKWATMRSSGGNIVKYGMPLSEAPKGVITPEGATWDRCCTVNVDFPMKVAMLGIMGLAGDFSELDKDQMRKVSLNIRFYKKWRSFIYLSRAYLLTPPINIGCRNGWVGIQLQNFKTDKNLVFCYRLDDFSSKRHFYLRGLNENEKYGISVVNVAENPQQRFLCRRWGASLMQDGILVEIGEKNRGTVFIVEVE